MTEQEKSIELIKEWIEKHEIVGNDAWWDDNTYYSLTLDQIRDIVNHASQDKQYPLKMAFAEAYDHEKNQKKEGEEMTNEEKDLCKTCKHYWVDFPIPHCKILDRQSVKHKSMDDTVQYPCLQCPFESYKKK